jgi:hypothetical protein
VTEHGIPIRKVRIGAISVRILEHRDDCPDPHVLATNIRHWKRYAIGRCINCERVGLVVLEADPGPTVYELEGPTDELSAGPIGDRP